MRACDLLACSYTSLNRLDKAGPLFIRALEYREKRLGSLHPETINPLHNLSYLRRQQGALEEALTLGQRALESSKERLGSTHPDKLESVSSVSSTLGALGRYEECEVLDRQALVDIQARLGPWHPDTLRMVHNLAYTLETANTKLDEARELAKQAFKGREEVLDSEHPHLESSRRLLEKIEKKVQSDNLKTTSET